VLRARRPAAVAATVARIRVVVASRCSRPTRGKVVRSLRAVCPSVPEEDQSIARQLGRAAPAGPACSRRGPAQSTRRTAAVADPTRRLRDRCCRCRRPGCEAGRSLAAGLISAAAQELSVVRAVLEMSTHDGRSAPAGVSRDGSMSGLAQWRFNRRTCQRLGREAQVLYLGPVAQPTWS